jgi:hypothetical protein
VIEPCPAPAVGGVAAVALVARLDMRTLLATRDLAVVTTVAAAQHFEVIDTGNGVPAAGAVTGLALVAGGDVVGQFLESSPTAPHWR